MEGRLPSLDVGLVATKRPSEKHAKMRKSWMIWTSRTELIQAPAAAVASLST